MNTFLCSTVQEESVLWDKFTCDGETSVIDGNEDYSYEEKEDQNIMVTDLETVVTKVVSESSDAVVGIGIAGGTNAADQIIGSGFIVSSNGLVVTNQHVVSGGEAKDFFVVIGEESDPIQVEKIYRDEVNDIALLKIESTDLKVLPLGDSTNIKVGQTAIAIGNPLGSLSNTVTVGSISALNREVELTDDYYRFSSRTHFDVIQTDAAINPGNSGGPLLNSSGEVVGINFATISGADNLSFALPINLVKQRIQELNEFGDFRLPFLGVEFQRRMVFFKNEGVIGAIVMDVVANSPAEKAGIVKGDVIVQFAGKDLEDESLLNLIQRSKIGDEVEVVIIREGESQTIKVTIADRNEFD
jgi:serine protease Do